MFIFIVVRYYDIGYSDDLAPITIYSSEVQVTIVYALKYETIRKFWPI